ncbi:putative C6 transcription factor [Aspergillus clavatus NRRL 1]|uniref:C6 transcription factor, putative n=1 Tax=Aspergillus clavatus (strain ATCC 1007 / CBS 513.65 / DSM 816 / NCTC 3887 / NRRL 1 / QM 1276 / 107) TaxID=344612 RepID=A1CSZ3_ASPCL|nr:C6 transcription factor, putative [Aspergillus clavatus NRRL 1]EAW06430.1 C6 transcription factor, putative [Aspergillus clavatus NRRL 1]
MVVGDKRPRAGACTTCRVRKRRCVPAGDKFNNCELCLSLSIPCSLSTEPGVFASANGAVASHHPVAEKLPPPEPPRHEVRPVRVRELPPEEPLLDLYLLATPVLFQELVALYFRFIHNVAHTLFHEASFLRLLIEGRASLIHVHAMCALAARFSKNPIFDGVAPGSRGKIYAAEAIRLFQERMNYASLETVQGAVLLGHLVGGEGDAQAKQAYIGIARAHAEVLSLWTMPPNSTVVHREERRRTWLSIRAADPWTIVDMSVNTGASLSSLNVLPEVDDVAFNTYDPELLRENSVQSSSRSDMWAQMAGTLEIYTRISVLLTRLSRGVITFDSYLSEVPLLTECLDGWVKNLPPTLTYRTANLAVFAKQGLGRTFLAMHMEYQHFRQMLFFPFLDARAKGTATTIADGVAQCRNSAQSVSQIIECFSKEDDCKLDYFLYSHVAIVSSCAHMQTLMLSEELPELRTARQHLVSNFEYLMDLKKHWPVLGQVITRLRDFQTTYQDTMCDPFASDNWLARFVIEHTAILAERQTPGQQPLNNSVPRTSQYNTGDESGILGLTGSLKSDSTLLIPPSYARGPAQESGKLSTLLDDHSLTSEALVNNALNWLLE